MARGEEQQTDIRLARPNETIALADAVVSAFRDDPAFRAFFDGPEFGTLAWGFANDLLTRRIATGSVWITDDQAALAMWDPPEGTVEPPPSTLTLPAENRARLDEYDERVHAAVTDEPHWYLGVLASRPALRGRGLATKAAQPGLDAARAAGVPAVLETTNPDNVPMYERRGWRVTAELDVIGIHVWVMQIDPS